MKWTLFILCSYFEQSTANDLISIENSATEDEQYVNIIVHTALKPVLIKLPELLVIYYMDDNYFSWLSNQYFNVFLTFIVNKLKEKILNKTPDKIKKQSPKLFKID